VAREYNFFCLLASFKEREPERNIFRSLFTQNPQKPPFLPLKIRASALLKLKKETIGGKSLKKH